MNRNNIEIDDQQHYTSNHEGTKRSMCLNPSRKDSGIIEFDLEGDKQDISNMFGEYKDQPGLENKGDENQVDNMAEQRAGTATKQGHTLTDWAQLIASVVCGSALCPLLVCIKENTLDKLSWRSILVSLMLIPWFGYEYTISSKKYLYNRSHIINKNYFKLIIPSGICYSLWLYALVYSSYYLNITHVLTFGNAQVLFVNMFKLWSGTQMTKFEIFGSIFSICGMILLGFDDIENDLLSYEGAITDLSKHSYNERQTKGVFVALAGSVASASFFLIQKRMGDQYSLPLNSFLISVVGLIMYLFINTIMVYSGIEDDYESNFLDIFSSFRVFFYMVLISIITGLGTNHLYLKVTNIFPSLLVSLSMLLQPICGGLIIFILRQQPLPTFISFMGIILVIIGLLIIRRELYQEDIKNIEIEEEEWKKSVMIPLVDFDHNQSSQIMETGKSSSYVADLPSNRNTSQPQSPHMLPSSRFSKAYYPKDSIILV